MTHLRIDSVAEPLAFEAAGRAASALLGRAEAMGFLKDMGTISRLDPDLISAVMTRLGRVGLVQDAIMQGGGKSLPRDRGDLVHLLEQINGALEQSPLPEQEWPAVRGVLGDDLLARLCRISVVSLRRYASGARPTPDAIAQKLHFLALVIGDLRGAYNEYGIRRWFQRARPQLGGRAPVDLLGRPWSIDSPPAAELRALARSLSGSPAA